MYLNTNVESIRIPSRAQNNRAWMAWLRHYAESIGAKLQNRKDPLKQQLTFRNWYTTDMRQTAREWVQKSQREQAEMAQNRAGLGLGGINVPNQNWMANPSQPDPTEFMTEYEAWLWRKQKQSPHIDVGKQHAYASVHPFGPGMHWNAALVNPMGAHAAHMSRIGQGPIG